MFPDLNRSWLSHCYVCWKCSFINHDWDNSADKGLLGQFSGQRLMTGTTQRTKAHDWDSPADKDYWDNSVDKSTRLEQPSEERLIGVIQRTKVYDWENPADKGSSLGQPSGQRLVTGTTQRTKAHDWDNPADKLQKQKQNTQGEAGWKFRFLLMKQ